LTQDQFASLVLILLGFVGLYLALVVVHFGLILQILLILLAQYQLATLVLILLGFVGLYLALVVVF
jgi:hypothetical protein